ncbi:AraC family transcriptional regulator [Sphingobacterium hungaricum]
MNTKIPIVDYCSLSLDKKAVFLAEGLNSYLLRNNDLVFPHRHNFYQFVLFTGGQGNHSIDFEHFEIESWQIYFMIPGQIHTWNFETDMQGYIFNFNAELFDTFLLRPDYLTQFNFFSGDSSKSVYTVKEQFRSQIQSILEQIILNKDDADFAKIALLYVFSLLNKQFVPNDDSVSSGYRYTILKNFNSLIELNYKSLKLPKEYAELLYITPNHLNALTKEHLGMPAGEIIRNRILLEAKRMLVIKEYTISEIAYELNFNDNSYFSKFFKKLTGFTPEEFRKNYIK